MKTETKLTAEQLKWRTEEDARVIERYNEIIKDKARLEMATKEAEKTIDNLQERVKAINNSLSSLRKN